MGMRVEQLLGSFTFIFLLLASFSFAATDDSFAVGYSVNDVEIFKDEVASVELTITNKLDALQSFQVFSEDPRWLVYLEPSSLSVEGGEDGVYTITLDPTTSIDDSDNYAVPIVIKSLTSSDTVKVSPTVTIQSEAFRQYAPAVFLDVEVGDDGEVDPRNAVPVELRVVNKNPLNFETFAIALEGDLFSDVYETTLGPNDDFLKELTFPIDTMQEPGNHSVAVTMIGNGQAIGSPKTIFYTIIPTYPQFVRDQEVKDSFLKKSWVVDLTNVANVAKKEQVLIPLDGISVLFTSTSHPYTKEQVDGADYLAFDIVLEPGQTTTLDVKMNMRTFFYVLFVIIVCLAVGILLYYVLRSPVVVSRKAQIIGGEGQASSNMKVLLNVRNRTGKALEAVKVFERLPHIAEVEESFEVGTVKPSKVMKNQRKGTLVRWDFVTLEPYEERIITYRINSKLSILGSLTLPATTVQFSAGGNRVRKVSFGGK